MRRGKSLIIFLFAIIGLAGFSASAQASEKLNFSNNLKPRTLHLIKNLLNHEQLDVAQADLNGDNLAEFIVRNSNCAHKTLCDFRILAENGDKIVEIGQIKAHNLLLGNDYNQGVRNLLAFNNPTNDYAFTVYVWEPRSVRYKIKE